MAKINGNEIRPGFVLDHDGGLWAAVKVSHVKPGKGGAFAQVEMKNLRDGRKLNEMGWLPPSPADTPVCQDDVGQ